MGFMDWVAMAEASDASDNAKQAKNKITKTNTKIKRLEQTIAELLAIQKRQQSLLAKIAKKLKVK